MTLEEFKGGLLSLPFPVRHMRAGVEDDCPVLCWQELRDSTLWGDNEPVALITNIQLDYFTSEEYDSAPDAVEACITALGCSWVCAGQGFDPDREEWVTTWTVQFFGD